MISFIKALTKIIEGFIGIISNKNLGLKTKTSLLYDDLRLFWMCLNYLIWKKKVFSFKSTSFNFKIYFDNLLSFYYLFNEIFCIGIYPLKKNLNFYIDAGANIGLTILWYKMFNPRMKIMAFEPDKKFFCLLQKNLKENRVENYLIYKIALSRKVGRTKFYHLKDRVQNLDSSLFLNQNLPFLVSWVRTDRLSNYINEPVSLLKMDIEGSEFDVLEEIISSSKLNLIEMIIFEAHHFNDKQKERFKLLCKKLAEKGKIQIRSFKNTSLVCYRA